MFCIAALLYSGVPWEAAAGFPLDPSRSYLSELAAADQPTSLLFRALDAGTGVLLLGALSFADRTAIPPRPARAAGFALAVFALLTIADALSPMACATSASRECAAADAAQTLGWSHQLHTLSSAGALVAAIVSAVLFACAAARERTLVRPLARRALWSISAALVLVSLIVSVLALLSAGEGALVDGGGFVQRAQVLLVSAYLAGYGVLTHRLRAAETLPSVSAADSDAAARGSHERSDTP